MNEEKRKTSAGALVFLFFATVLAGLILNFIYIALVDLIPFVQINLFTALGYGFILGIMIMVLRSRLKIISNIAPTIVVFVAMLIVLFFMWQTWFGMWYTRIVDDGMYWWHDMDMLRPWQLDELFYALRWMMAYGNLFTEFISDLRFFNEHGTFSMFDRDITGWVLGLIWFGEFVILMGIPLILAHTSPGVFIHALDAWAKPKYISLEFEAFQEHEVQAIKEAYPEEALRSLSERPVNTRTSGKVSKIGLLFIDGTPTDYIGVFRAGVNATDTEKNIAKGPHNLLALIQLGSEKREALLTLLTEKHGELNLTWDEVIEDNKKNEQKEGEES